MGEVRIDMKDWSPATVGVTSGPARVNETKSEPPELLPISGADLAKKISEHYKDEEIVNPTVFEILKEIITRAHKEDLEVFKLALTASDSDPRTASQVDTRWGKFELSKLHRKHNSMSDILLKQIRAKRKYLPTLGISPEWDAFADLYPLLPWDNIWVAGGYALLMLLGLSREKPHWDASDLDIWAGASSAKPVRDAALCWAQSVCSEGTVSCKMYSRVFKISGWHPKLQSEIKIDIIPVPDAALIGEIMERFDIPTCRVAYRYQGEGKLEFRISRNVLDGAILTCMCCDLLQASNWMASRNEKRVEKYRSRGFVHFYTEYILCSHCKTMMETGSMLELVTEGQLRSWRMERYINTTMAEFRDEKLVAAAVVAPRGRADGAPEAPGAPDADAPTRENVATAIRNAFQENDPDIRQYLAEYLEAQQQAEHDDEAMLRARVSLLDRVRGFYNWLVHGEDEPEDDSEDELTAEQVRELGLSLGYYKHDTSA